MMMDDVQRKFKIFPSTYQTSDFQQFQRTKIKLNHEQTIAVGENYALPTAVHNRITDRQTIASRFEKLRKSGGSRMQTKEAARTMPFIQGPSNTNSDRLLLTRQEERTASIPTSRAAMMQPSST